mmetsp:Transcript_61708/g.74243  ORF Transcript_61708/g.74243 Transcript_61708/m.74243 type:complete len:136 (-) Transcript_61708:442-849(-)
MKNCFLQLITLTTALLSNKVTVNAFTSPFSCLSCRIPRTFVTSTIGLSKPPTTSLGMSDGKEKLNEIDLMCITNAAIFCAEEEDECDLDQVESIVNQLNDQSEILQEELTTLEDLDKNLSKFKGVHPIPAESKKR